MFIYLTLNQKLRRYVQIIIFHSFHLLKKYCELKLDIQGIIKKIKVVIYFISLKIITKSVFPTPRLNF